jgi:hypothetical protein
MDTNPKENMKVHNLIECWGNRLSELSVTPYSDRAHAEKDWESKISEFLDGSTIDDRDVIAKARAGSWCFEHSDGFIALETVDVRDPR